MDILIQTIGDIINADLGSPLAAFIALLLVSLAILGFMSLTAGGLSFIERRVAGRMQSRIGPNRVGPQGILQFMADGLKCAQKEDLIPDGADRLLFKLAPVLCFIGVFGTFAVLPWGNGFFASELNVGLLYLMSVTSLVVIGMLMAGWSSNNKWSLLGGMRSAAQMVSYEIPVALSLLPVILLCGSLSFKELIGAQGAMPWDWNILNSPFTFISFFIFFLAALAEGNRTPFDIPEGESELVAGYCTEYSGLRFVFFFFAEWANLYVIGAVAAAVFLGGGHLPFGLESDIVSLLVFFAKSFFMVFIIIWLRWTLPRFRVDQMMTLCWKTLIPLSFVMLFGQAITLLIYHELTFLQSIVSLVLFAICVLVGVKFVSRVLVNIKEQKYKMMHTLTGS
ncbi:MAG: NADH-quinone oxidoreductase subunit NuoH [Planctomycetes bacterium]|nr:NADH-quinone oxidoreductase subunit NuoH [Planctomycetota bacterium]